MLARTLIRTISRLMKNEGKKKEEKGEENPRKPIRYICHTFTASHMLIHRPSSLFLSLSLFISRCISLINAKPHIHATR